MNLQGRNTARVTAALRSNLPNLRALQQPPRTSFSFDYVPVQIKSAELIPGETNRWCYTVEIVSLKKGDYGFDSHDEIEIFKAYNGWEATNTATQVLTLGGEDPDDLPEGFTLEHCPEGLVTHATAHYFSDADAGSDDGFAYFLFSEPNVLVGGCT
tara:strand:+ start:2858 stop:3325 length:468 start_codon:yes stop_codon:yes gene_type:complete